jgi:hypothetical protein
MLRVLLQAMVGMLLQVLTACSAQRYQRHPQHLALAVQRENSAVVLLVVLLLTADACVYVCDVCRALAALARSSMSSDPDDLTLVSQLMAVAATTLDRCDVSWQPLLHTSGSSNCGAAACCDSSVVLLPERWSHGLRPGSLRVVGY